MGSSPSGGIDEDLVDPLEVDLTDSAHSAGLCMMQSEDILHLLTDSTKLHGLEQKIDCEKDAGQDTEKALGGFQSTLQQAMQELPGKSSFEDNPVETYKQVGCEMPSVVCPKVESDLQDPPCGPSLSQVTAG